jgi:hypothetical protein
MNMPSSGRPREDKKSLHANPCGVYKDSNLAEKPPSFLVSFPATAGLIASWSISRSRINPWLVRGGEIALYMCEMRWSRAGAAPGRNQG